MEPDRVLRAPSTLTRDRPTTAYNGPLTQTKYRVLNNVGIRPSAPKLLTNIQSEQATRSILRPVSAPRIQSQLPQKALATTNNHTTGLGTRIPSSLAKPTSVRQVISKTTLTVSSSIRPTIQPAKLRAPTDQARNNRTSKPIASATTTTTNLPSVRIPTASISKPPIRQISSNWSDSQKPKQPIQESPLLDLVTNDVSEIRNLLEQLLNLLKSSEDCQESLEEENVRLRKENQELRAIIQSSVSELERPEISSHQDQRTLGSDKFYSPMS